MLAFNWKSRKTRALIGALCLLVLCMGAVKLEHYEVRHGPLHRASGPKPGGWFSVSFTKPPGESLVLGGYRAYNNTTSPITIIGIQPTTNPVGAHFECGYVTDGSIGAVNLDDLSPNARKNFRSFPLTIPAGQTAKSSHQTELIAIVSADTPGQFVVDGMLVTYEWRGRKYKDYFPSVFSLCTQSSCVDISNLPPPPANWP